MESTVQDVGLEALGPEALDPEFQVSGVRLQGLQLILNLTLLALQVVPLFLLDLFLLYERIAGRLNTRELGLETLDLVLQTERSGSPLVCCFDLLAQSSGFSQFFVPHGPVGIMGRLPLSL